MSKRDGKDLLLTLRENGLLDYGSTFLGEDVRAIIGISEPETDGRTFAEIRRAVERMALAEMAAVDYVRNALLGEGKYVKNVDGNYKVLLPSENQKQATIYIASATGKLGRANKLLTNTPHDSIGDDERNKLLTRISAKKAHGRHMPGANRK